MSSDLLSEPQMPVVPITKNQPSAPAQPMPSEPALLMALAEMHRQGRFEKPPAKEPT
jgi:hypothetical protein